MNRYLIVLVLSLLIPMAAYADCGCDPCCEPCCKQDTCTRPACNTCDEGCAKPCACMEWHDYCGCEMVTGLCISLEADCCDGTEGPLWLLIRDGDFKDVVMIELAGPIEGYYTMMYEFDEPVRADTLVEAVIINKTDDPVTMMWFNVYGMFGCCGGWDYFDFSCPGVVIGPGGCPRMVLF